MDNTVKFKILTMYAHGERSYMEIARVSGAKFSEVKRVIEEERDYMAISKQKRQEIIKLLGEGMTIKGIEKLTGISHGTISTISKEIKAVMKSDIEKEAVETSVESGEIAVPGEEPEKEEASEPAEESQNPEPGLLVEYADDGREYVRTGENVQEDDEEFTSEPSGKSEVLKDSVILRLRDFADEEEDTIRRYISWIWTKVRNLRDIESTFAADGRYDEANDIANMIGKITATLDEICGKM